MDPREHCITEPSCGAKKAKCVRKQNLLVYDKTNPCHPTVPKSCYSIPHLKKANAKKIRVCTGADLKRMCPPKLCACPSSKQRASGLWASIGRLLGFGVKGALAGGLIYWTYGIGLWGRPDETEQIYIDLCKYAFKPDKKEMAKLMQVAREQQACFNKTCDIYAARKMQMAEDESEASSEGVLITEDAILAQMSMCQKAPSIRENTNSLKNRWNRFVLCSFSFIADLPHRLFGKDEEEEEAEKAQTEKEKEKAEEELKAQKNKCKERKKCGAADADEATDAKK